MRHAAVDNMTPKARVILLPACSNEPVDVLDRGVMVWIVKEPDELANGLVCI